VAGKAARWLGYISFDRIIDNRNAEPIIHRKAKALVSAMVHVGLTVRFPPIEHMGPVPIAIGFEPHQPYQFVIFGEKASLEDVALPVAEQFQADLYLNTGEISAPASNRQGCG